MDVQEATTKLRELAETLSKDLQPNFDERFPSAILALAWMRAIRFEWEALAASDKEPLLRDAMDVAKEMLRRDGIDPEEVCVNFGDEVRPRMVNVMGSKHMSISGLIKFAVPVSAIYADKVIDALVIAEKFWEKRKSAPPLPTSVPEIQPEQPSKPAPKTSWEFFGFAGPVPFDVLYEKYMNGYPVKTLEIQNHYRHCLSEINKNDGRARH